MANELLFDVAGGVATITLNRPEKKNAFTDEMVQTWISLLDECGRRDDVNVVVVTAAGDTFSAGGDMGGLKEKSEQTPLEAKDRISRNTQALVARAVAFEKPLIAAINGAAIGGGMDIALMCDVRLGSESARFCESYARMALIPGAGGAYFLPRIVGASAALDLFWTARWVNASEALQLGLLNRVFPDSEFRDGVASYAHQIASAAPVSMRFIKRLVYQGLKTDLATHFDALSSHIALVRTSNDHREAVAAFKEKREPKFTGS